MSRRERTGEQLSFLSVRKPPSRVEFPDSDDTSEQDYRVNRLITFSQIEDIIYKHIAGVEPVNTFERSEQVSLAIDWFLVLANFTWRYRDNYCLMAKYPDWSLEDVFWRFYPTGWDGDKLLDILSTHKARFQESPIKGISPLTKAAVFQNLLPVWTDGVKKFELDNLEKQTVMREVANSLGISDGMAIAETVESIGRRIINQRLEQLVDDDDDFSYIAKPDCLLEIDVDGEVFQLQVQPDYVKRQRFKRKTTKKKLIVVKRIAGDFKDANSQNLADLDSPYGKTMLVYNWLLGQIGQKVELVKPQWARLINRQRRRVFLIPRDTPDKYQPSEVQTALENLREDPENMFCPMPEMTPQMQESAKELLFETLRISQRVKI